MVNAGKWLRNFLTGKKEKNQARLIERKIWLQLPPPPPPPPPTTPNGESMRSFQLETVPPKQTPKDQLSPPSLLFMPQLSKAGAKKPSFVTIQQVAAIKIQACFRSFLARKALRALKGLVKLQAVVRGFLVRKEAAATLRGMQALLTVQVRARAQRVRMIEEVHSMQWKENNQRRRVNDSKFQHFYDMERNIEMNTTQSKTNSKNKKSNPTPQTETKDQRLFKYHKTPSSSTEMYSDTPNETDSFHMTPKTRRISSSEASSSREDGSYSIPQDSSFFPNYMANTKSWKAKARSQSAPRHRNALSDSNQSGKHRMSVDGRNNISRGKEKIPYWPEEFERLVSNTDYYRFITA